MTTTPGTSPAAAGSRAADTCSRCDTRLTGPFCHSCGVEIEGPRLDPRGALRWIAGRLSWLGARLARTLLDLTIRPAEVVWVYLGGHRDRYLAPVSYAVVMVLLERVAFWVLHGFSGLIGRPAAALLIQPDAYARLAHLPVLAAVAVIWWLFFRRSGYNVLEMMAVALYAYGHFVVLWTVFALVTGVLPIQGMLLLRWAPQLQLVLALAYFVYAGTAVFRENPALVALKIAVSAAVPLEVLAAVDSLLKHR